MTNKKLTIKDRQKAQPKAVQFLSEAERATIKQTVAKSLTEPQYSVFIYTCQALGLNPLLNEITAIVYGGTMSIQVMRDGFLAIAHKSGKFAGLESGIKYDDQKKLIGWAKVYHKDFQVPVYQEAEFEEYTTNRNLWTSKPKTMIKKVAESMALRKAFNVNGVYAPEEMEKDIQQPQTNGQLKDANQSATDKQIETLKSLLPKEQWAAVNEANYTFQEAANRIQELVMSKPKEQKA
jgi:phage recombination protein Bet